MKQRWQQLWLDLGANGNSEEVYQFLSDAYEGAGRFYHTLDHINVCLQELESVAALTENYKAVALAIWFHDVIYDVRRNDNESRSAQVARDICPRAGVSEEVIQKTVELIQITRHDQAPAGIDQKLITDIDLSILGRSEREYAAYEQAIRKEYSHVSEVRYRSGRTEVLRSFLARPSIYSLDYFYSRYQQQAVLNLQRAIRNLS